MIARKMNQVRRIYEGYCTSVKISTLTFVVAFEVGLVTNSSLVHADGEGLCCEEAQAFGR